MAEQSNNYLVNLFRGDVPLMMTFWVFYVLIGIALAFIPIVNLVSYVYLPIALWNSAGKYEGAAIWKILAQIMAALSLIGFVFFVLIALGVMSISP